MKSVPIDPKAAPLKNGRSVCERSQVAKCGKKGNPLHVALRVRFTAGQRKALQRGARRARVTVDELAAFIMDEAALGFTPEFLEENARELRNREMRRQDEAQQAVGRADRRERGEVAIEVSRATMRAIVKGAELAGVSDGKLVGFIMESMDKNLIVESGKVYGGRHAAPA